MYRTAFLLSQAEDLVLCARIDPHMACDITICTPIFLIDTSSRTFLLGPYDDELRYTAPAIIEHSGGLCDATI